VACGRVGDVDSHGRNQPAGGRAEAGTPLLALPPRGMTPSVVSTSMPARERHRAAFPLRNPPNYPHRIRRIREAAQRRIGATGVSL